MMNNGKNEDTESQNSQQQVDRYRRYWFISRLTVFCLLTAGILAVMTGYGLIESTELITIYIKALLTLATTAVMAYVTGSVIDYNRGFGMFSSQKTSSYSGPYPYTRYSPRHPRDTSYRNAEQGLEDPAGYDGSEAKG